MKILQTIDKQILAYWNTAEDERLWAYLATMPIFVLIIDVMTHGF